MPKRLRFKKSKVKKILHFSILSNDIKVTTPDNSDYSSQNYDLQLKSEGTQNSQDSNLAISQPSQSQTGASSQDLIYKSKIKTLQLAKILI